MKSYPPPAPALPVCFFLCTLLVAPWARGQFVAFNDHAPGVNTHSNATTWNIFGNPPGAVGPLKDVASGRELPVTVTITRSGTINAGSSASEPSPGTPLYNVFHGYVDFQGSGNADAVAQVLSDAIVTYTFTGLDPNRTYSFIGSAVRGGSGGNYAQRWSLFQLDGAVSFTSAHTSGCLTNGFAANQVVVNTGINLAGDMADWEQIVPGPNGTLSVSTVQYTGALPAGGTANGPYCYGLSGFRLEESAPDTPVSIKTQPTNTTVVELSAARFNVAVAGSPAPTLQWLRNDIPIAGATSSTYSIPSVALVDNGSLFKVIAQNLVSNKTYSATSSVAGLTVMADTNPPVLLGAQAVGLSQVLVTFSEKITPSTATNLANYSLTSGAVALSILNASLDASQTNVTLSVSAMNDSSACTLRVSHLTDQSAARNEIAANSEATFVASSYTPISLGNSVPVGTQISAGNGYDIAGGGAGVRGVADQGQFSYQLRSGDFDVKVRLDSLGLVDAWSQAGLMARDSLNAGARSASVLATPSISGVFFQVRNATNATSSQSGSFPVNYPNTWLRLKRAGNVLTGFASFDGLNWSQLGTVSMTLPSNLYLGFVVSSHDINGLATAAFRDFSAVTSVGTDAIPQLEPLGQCSRRTSLVISEIMYHPAQSNLAFVEIFNSRGEPQDMSGYRLSGDIDYIFPDGSTLPGGGFMVVAKSPADLQKAYSLPGVLGPYTNDLGHGSGTVRLLNQAGAVFLEVKYSDQPPWPAAADGAGHSLVLARPSFGEDNPQAWSASDRIGGSPGKIDGYTPDPLRSVVINEFLAHTDDPELDYIELYNHSANPVDLSGCILTDDEATNKFVVPLGTIIPARGFVVYNQTNLNFSLSAAGETLYFKNPTQTRMVDAVRYEAQENGVSMGRYPDGGDQFYRMKTKTPGSSNSGIRVDDIVINEIMYSPISLNDDEQYVELYNRGSQAVNLSGWKFISGISFTFPPNTLLPADGYLVVARDRARIQAIYPNLNVGNLVGDFGGRLSHNGERLALAMPDLLVSTNSSGAVNTNTIFVVVAEVTFRNGGRWPQWANGGGSSLELIHPASDPRQAANWADSDETHKAPWTQISTTGTIDNGRTSSILADQLQVLLQGAGECLIDNVQVLDPNGNNRIANSTFESGANGWTAEGTESPSGPEPAEGSQSSRSYHVRAIDRGDNQVNRIRTPLTSSLPVGTRNVTIKADVRWLKGHPEILLRFRGNWLECVGEMALPQRPGTPGAPNSQRVNNAPPTISEVQHAPILPQAGQPVIITAHPQDSDGISSVVLKYRLDPATSYSSIAMNDSGTNGDAVAGDGIYSATIPGQSAGTTIAFYVQATDRAAVPATATFPNNAPVRECLARVGEIIPPGNFPVYRIWMTQNTLNAWSSRNKLDNTPNDVTFVLGQDRVVYNVLALYAGSPHIAPGYCGPTCSRCAYTLTFPADDLFLGEQNLVLDWPGGHGNETTAMQEEMGYWIADRINLPYSHRYIIRLHVNGVTDDARSAVFEAVMQPGGGFIDSWSSQDTGGEFFKIDQCFEFSDSGGNLTAPGPLLQNFTTTGGVKKREAYRWNFNHRAGDRFNNYTDIFSLVDALNSSRPEPYTSAAESLVDIEEWMGIFATEHIIVNFDAYGHLIGKNMYAYLPPHGKWQLYMFDLDWLMLAALNFSGSYGPSTAPMFNAEDPTIVTMYGQPAFLRAYWRAVERAVQGPLDPAQYNPVMDAKYRSLVANGVAWCDGQPLTDPAVLKNWFSQRRAALQTQLANVAAPLAVSKVVATNDVAQITGTAPIAAQTIWFNGHAYPLIWNSVNTWTASVPLSPGTNTFNVVGVDLKGNPVSGASTTVTATYSGSSPSPAGQVVINEIMYMPAATNAEFVELYNASTNKSFDLSGWQLRGLGYTFPQGALLGPRKFLVLAASRSGFAAAYGATNAIFDTYSGSLQSDGETLTLLLPGTNGTPDQVVSKLRYASSTPWPTEPLGTGSSLQLIDPLQDAWRVGNWAAASTNTGNATPQWVHVVARGTASSSRLSIYLQSPGIVYVDDITLVAGTVPDNGPNLLVNGDFEAPLSGPWTLASTFSSSSLDAVIKHTGAGGLQVVSSGVGDGNGNAIYQDISPALVNGQPYTLSFWYLQSTNLGAPNLVVELGGAGVSSGSIKTLLPGSGPVLKSVTPGSPNSVAAVLPAFPSVWINEVESQNRTGITNNAGQRTPWLELYNPSTNTVPLAGLYLANSYENPLAWSFPPGTSLAPGQFKVVFADGLTNLNSATESHTSFSLSPGAGSILLSRLYNGQPQVLDYLDYTNVTPNQSVGSFPDGQIFDRQQFFFVTPGATNNGSSAPLSVRINEWMAGNTHTLPNPASGKYSDWFELYNFGEAPADLSGYYLTDSLTNQFKFQIPSGYIIPPHGFLLVWADGKATSGTPDLHISFKLSKSGENLGLCGPDGVAIDYITYPAQSDDVSQGRFPDGGPNFYFMSSASPRTNNLVANMPPEFLPASDRVFTLGQTIALTLTAIDRDMPPQTVTYSLGPNPPSGAAVNPLNGLFIWTPSSAPSTNLISIVATDSGTPPLSATQRFTITVLKPPTLSGFAVLGDQLTFTWDSIAGQSYQLEFSEDLSVPVWKPSGGPMLGTGRELTVSVELAGSNQRFYRIRVLP